MGNRGPGGEEGESRSSICKESCIKSSVAAHPTTIAAHPTTIQQPLSVTIFISPIIIHNPIHTHVATSPAIICHITYTHAHTPDTHSLTPVICHII